MANNVGTLITSPVRPQSDADKFPIGLQNEILGGIHNTPTITDRNAIFQERRAEGMLATVASESGRIYQLQGGTGNPNWVDIFQPTNSSIQNLQSVTADLQTSTTSLQNSTIALQNAISAPIYEDDAAADNDVNLSEGSFYRTVAGGRALYVKAPPTIVGNPWPGSSLTAIGGQNLHWQRNGVDISGETNSTYTVTVGDVGKTITVRNGTLVSEPVVVTIPGLISALDAAAGVITSTGGEVTRWENVDGSSQLYSLTTPTSPTYVSGAVVTNGTAQGRMAEQVAKKSTTSLPDALGGTPGKGFTCTGLTYDSIRNSYWVANDGRGEPLSSTFNPSIVEIDKNGVKLSEINVKALCPDALSIQGVCIDSNNTLWVASVSENKLHNFTKNGTFIKSYTVDTSPNGLTFDASNQLLIVIYDVNGICKTYDLNTGANVSTLPTSPAIDQVQWLSDGSLVGTYGNNGVDGNISQLVPGGSWRSRLNLYEANSVEGISAANGVLKIANDAYFHQTTPPINRILNYGLPAFSPVQVIDVVMCVKRDLRPTNTTPFILLGDPSSAPGFAIYSTNSTNDNQIQITCNTGVGTSNQSLATLVVGSLTAKCVIRVRLDLSTKLASVWYNGTLISSSLSFPNCGNTILVGQLAIGGAPAPLARWISASYYDLWVGTDVNENQFALVDAYVRLKSGVTPVPVVVTPPSVSGTRIVGQTLTATPATWVETPTSVTSQWYRGANPISGATGNTYLLTNADAGFLISFTNVGSNSSGSTTTSSTETEVVMGGISSFATDVGATPSTNRLTLNSTQNAVRVWAGEIPYTEPYLDVYYTKNSGTPIKLRTNRFEGRIISAPTGTNFAFSTADGRSLKVTPMTTPATLNLSFPISGIANADKAGPPLWNPTASHITLPAYNSSFQITSSGELPIFISEFNGVAWTPQRWIKLPASGTIKVQATYKQIAVANYSGVPISIQGPSGTVIGGNSALMHLPFLAPTGTTRNVSTVSGFSGALAAAVAGDQILMAPGVYNLDFAIDRTTFAANHGAGSPQRQGGEGIMIRSASGTGTVVIGGTGGTAGNWDLGRSTPLSGALPFMMSGITLNFSGLNAGFSYVGGYALMEDVIASGPNITGVSIKDLMSFGTISSGDMNAKAIALRCSAFDSCADIWNAYGNGAVNQGNSVVTLIDCQGHRAGTGVDAQCLTTHNRMPFLIYGGHYSDATTFVVQGAANDDKTYMYFVKTTPGARNASLLWINGFGCDLSGAISDIKLNPTGGYMETSRISTHTGFVANGLFREAENNQLYIAGNIINSQTTAYYPNISTQTQYRNNIVTSGTTAHLVNADSQTGLVDFTANTVINTTTAFNLNSNNLTVGFRGNATKNNTNSISTTVSGAGRIIPRGYNTLDLFISNNYQSGNADILGVDAGLDNNYFPISGGNCYANVVPTGIGVDYIGGSDYQGFPTYYATGVADRGARSLPRIISGAELYPDIYL